MKVIWAMEENSVKKLKIKIKATMAIMMKKALEMKLWSSFIFFSIWL